MSVTLRGVDTCPYYQGDWTNYSSATWAKANLIRFSVYANPAKVTDSNSYLAEVQANIDFINAGVIPGLTNGARVLINVHPYNQKTFINSPADILTLVQTWEMIAKAFKGNRNICMYEMCNEPAGTDAQINELMAQLYATIRSIDSQQRIALVNPHQTAANFSKVIPPKNAKFIYYAFHHYSPFAFTNQGLGNYPKGVTWAPTTANIQGLNNEFAPVIAFQKKYRIPIIVTEYSCCIYGDIPSRLAWLKASMDIFESRSWPYIYHSWREAPEWDPEHDPTTILKLLESYWSKNIPPSTNMLSRTLQNVKAKFINTL